MKDEATYYLSTQNFHAPRKNLQSYPNKQEDARVALALSPIYEYNFKKQNLKLSIKPPLTSAELASLITCKLKKLIIMSGMSSVDDHYTIVGSLSYTEPEHSELKSLHKLREESFTKAEQDEQNWIKGEEKTFNAIFENPERILADPKLLAKPIITYADASKHPVCQSFYRDLMLLVNQGGKSEDEINFVGALNNFVEEKIMRNYSVLIERWRKEKVYCIVYENEKDKQVLNFEILVKRLLTENAIKEMALFVVVARTLSPDCLFYKGGKKKTNVGDKLLRAVMKLCYRESPHVMQYVCIKIQPRPLPKTLDDSDHSADSQSSSEEEKQRSSSPASTDSSPVKDSSGFIWNQLTEASREIKPVIAEKKDDSSRSIHNQLSLEEEKQLLRSGKCPDSSSAQYSPGFQWNQPAKSHPIEFNIKADSSPEVKSNTVQIDLDTLALWYNLTFSNYSSYEKLCILTCLQQLGKIPPSFNNIQKTQELPPDYSKLAGTIGAFNKHTESPQPVKTSLPPPNRGMQNLLN